VAVDPSDPQSYEPRGVMGGAMRVIRRRLFNLWSRSPQQWTNAISNDSSFISSSAMPFATRRQLQRLPWRVKQGGDMPATGVVSDVYQGGGQWDEGVDSAKGVEVEVEGGFRIFGRRSPDSDSFWNSQRQTQREHLQQQQQLQQQRPPSALQNWLLNSLYDGVSGGAGKAAGWGGLSTLSTVLRAPSAVAARARDTYSATSNVIGNFFFDREPSVTPAPVAVPVPVPTATVIEDNVGAVDASTVPAPVAAPVTAITLVPALPTVPVSAEVGDKDKDKDKDRDKDKDKDRDKDRVSWWKSLLPASVRQQPPSPPSAPSPPISDHPLVSATKSAASAAQGAVGGLVGGVGHLAGGVVQVSQGIAATLAGQRNDSSSDSKSDSMDARQEAQAQVAGRRERGYKWPWEVFYRGDIPFFENEGEGEGENKSISISTNTTVATVVPSDIGISLGKMYDTYDGT
jgi:hypothetical protein